MGKIKFLSVILAAAILLSGCAEKSAAPPENDTRIVWNFENADERGELYTDHKERLNFIDFETMNDALLCSKPNCTHAKENECSAFGMDNHPILHGDKLYFFDVETNFGGDEITDTTTVYKAEPDGTNRAKVCEIEGLALLGYTRMLIVGGKAYFSMDKTGWNEEQTASSGYNEVWFCSFDFSTEKFEKIEMLHKGWCSSSWIFGIFENKVIFSYAYSEEKPPFTMNTSEIGKYYINVYKTYDAESGEFAELTLPEPLYVGSGYYVYEKDGGAAALSENGAETLLPGFPADGNLVIADGKLFNYFKEMCADLSNGKTYRLKSSDNIAAYSNGNYILKDIGRYTKIPEGDYIGSEV